jgi:hypothetical protein
MSKIAEQQDQKPEQVIEEKPTIDDALKLIEQLKSTNDRLLEESKKTKEKFKLANDKLSIAEKEKLEKEGNYKELLEQTKNENKGLKQKMLLSNIQSTIAKYAKDAVDLEDVINQPKFKHILESGIDSENLSFDEEVAKLYVSEVYKAKPYLKKGQVANVVTDKPQYKSEDKANKDYSSLNAKETEELIKKLYG